MNPAQTAKGNGPFKSGFSDVNGLDNGTGINH